MNDDLRSSGCAPGPNAETYETVAKEKWRVGRLEGLDAAGLGRKLVRCAALAVAGIALWINARFAADLQHAGARALQGSVVMPTRCGPIEYQQAGAGVPLLVVHGSDGGHDQGMAFSGALAQRGIRVIAVSRFGYLRTPMPADASAAAQADAPACLLDALGIDRAAVMGGSAGAPSALQMAIRHPARVSALMLVVPLAYKPPAEADSAPPLPAIRAPTLIVSAVDDGYGTYASAQYRAQGIAGARFIGLPEGGHTWVGHNDAVLSAITSLLAAGPGR